MHRSGKGAGIYLLLCLLMLAWPQGHAYASGAPPGRRPGPDGLDIEPAPRRSSIGYVYTVQPGDTLWDIAVAHGLMPDDLTLYNQSLDLDMVHPGDTLFVPASPATVPRKTPPPTPIATKAPSKATPPSKPAAATNLPAATPAAAPAQPGAAAPGLAPQLAGWPEALLKSINEQRAARKVPALTWSPELALAAQAHAQDCARRNWGSHVGSDGAALRARLARAGYAARATSENWANASGVQATFGMWWNEPPGNDPHRRNILDPAYKEIGIGIAKGWWGYYFVADFGSR